MKAKNVLVLHVAVVLMVLQLHASDPTDHFRSVQSGTWSQVTTWESSIDSLMWIASTLAPTNSAKSIAIRAPDSVTIDAAISVKLLKVSAGAILRYSGPGISLTLVDDETVVDDFIINGRYDLYGDTLIFVGTKPTVRVDSGGEVRVYQNAGGESDDFARDTHVYFKTGALFSWYESLGFQTADVAYFPNATLSDKAIFRVNASMGFVGANTNTVFNCKFEVASGYSLTFRNKGTKTFRDGFGGDGTIIHSGPDSCGPFRITSPSATIDQSLTIILEHSTGIALDITLDAYVTMNGIPTLRVGTAQFPNAVLLVSGTLFHNAANPIDISLGSLVVDGGIAGVGAFMGSLTSSVTIGASGVASALYFDNSGTGNYLQTLTVAQGGSLTLGNILNIAPGASFGTVINDGYLNANGFLTLKSNGMGTARVGVSSNPIVGDAIVERYIPPNRAWRLLTAPVIGTQSINAAWQEGNTNTTLDCAQNTGAPGYGTHITNDGTNGYDVNTTNNASIKSWNNGWIIPASTLMTAITAHRAYFIFVRGDRTICLSDGVNAVQTETVLRSIGTLYGGDVAIPYSGTPGDFIMLGNPYPSAIDLTQVLVRSTGIDPQKFWVWDPAYGVHGGYVAYFNGTISPSSTPSYSGPDAVLIAQTAQGFFFQATAPTATMLFQEGDKVSGAQPPIFGRGAHAEIHVNVYDSTQALVDGAAIQFNAQGMTSGASKLFNDGENVYLARSDSAFAIQSRALPQKPDTFFIDMTGMKEQVYQLHFFANENFTGNARGRLVDRLLGTETMIDTDTMVYHFSVGADTATFKHRFLIVCDSIPVNSQVTQSNLMVYPNPVQGVLSVRGVNVPATATITDLLGRIVLQRIITANTINCSFLQKGMYLLKIGNKVAKFNKQ